MHFKIIVCIIIFGFMLLSVADISCAGMSDNAMRLSQNQSIVFSPGWFNGSKQYAVSIANRIDPKKSVMEKIVGYVQNGLSVKVAKNSIDRPQLELKHKMRGSGESKVSISGATGNSTKPPPAANNADEMPAYIRSKIQEYITANAPLCGSCQIGPYREKYYAVWDTFLNNRPFLNIQAFDSSGNTLYTKTLSDAGWLSDARTDNVSMLDTGDIAVFWSQPDASFNLSLKTQAPGSTGDFLSRDVIRPAIREVNFSNLVKSALLSPYLNSFTPDMAKRLNYAISEANLVIVNNRDIIDIKNIFSGLNTRMSRIITEYQDSVEPYYEKMIKGLLKNISTLQGKNIISGKMSKEDIEKLLPGDINTILEKLRMAKDRSFAEEYILQEEAKYRKTYIGPNKRLLDEKMKVIFDSFTGKLSGALEGAGAAKKQ